MLLSTRLDWERFRQVIAEHGVTLYLVAIPITSLGIVAYTARWWALLIPLGLKPSFVKAIVDSLVGLFYGLFVPTGLAGDAVRALRLGKRRQDEQHHALQKAFVSVAVDRIIGLFALLLLFGIPLIGNRAKWQGLQVSWLGGAIVAGLVLAMALVAGLGQPLLRRLTAWVQHKEQAGSIRPPLLKWLLHKVVQFWNVFQDYAQARRFVALSIVIAVLYQLCLTWVYYAAGAVLGIEVGFGDYVWIVALVTLAQILPITVAGVGVREGLFAFLLGQYGVTTETSLALSLVVFSVTLLFGLLGGVLELVGL